MFIVLFVSKNGDWIDLSYSIFITLKCKPLNEYNLHKNITNCQFLSTKINLYCNDCCLQRENF